MGKHLYIPKGEEGGKPQRRLAMCLEECIADQCPIDIVTEDELLLQNDPTYAVGHRGGYIDIVLTYVLVPLGGEDVSLVLVYTDIEGDSVLDNREV